MTRFHPQVTHDSVCSGWHVKFPPCVLTLCEHTSLHNVTHAHAMSLHCANSYTVEFPWTTTWNRNSWWSRCLLVLSVAHVQLQWKKLGQATRLLVRSVAHVQCPMEKLGQATHLLALGVWWEGSRRSVFMEPLSIMASRCRVG